MAQFIATELSDNDKVIVDGSTIASIKRQCSEKGVTEYEIYRVWDGKLMEVVTKKGMDRQ